MAETTEFSFPFDSEPINGKQDREYYAADFARYFEAFISSGLFLDKGTSLQIIANGDMTVTLKPGKMMINGYRYDNTEDIIIQIPAADGVLNRIDRIAITWSNADRDIHYTLQQGEFSYNPVAPECRRTAEYKDYVVADIYVQAGAISIAQKDITDTRLDTAVCGLAIPFSNIDTSKLYDQIQDALKEFQAVQEAGYIEWNQSMREKYDNYFSETAETVNAWVQLIKGQIDKDEALNLQNQINALKYMYVKDTTLYMPQTMASVSNGVLSIGTLDEGGTA